MACLKRFLLIALFAPTSLLATPSDLSTLDIESLMNSDVQLTSVMKRLQSAHETSASVYVLSGDEIARSGVTSIPEALRLVPGIEARQIDNNYWAISSRGTAGLYVSKLLVLIDGQSIYNPVHAGVNWEMLNLPLFDIERIEIVRGPGGQLWGSNATNGVINIITKHSEDTRSAAMQISTGNMLNYQAAVRYGGELSQLGSYRISAISQSISESDDVLYDEQPNDSSQSNGISGRLDLNLSDDLFWLIQGSYQEQEINSKASVADVISYNTYRTFNKSDQNNHRLMSRIDHSISENASQMLQMTYAHTYSEDIYYNEKNRSIDIDYQMNTKIGSTQFDWGLNYRFSKLKMSDTDYVSMLEDESNLKQYGGFIQSQFIVIPDTLRGVLGNKSEYNNLTGWEHQPMARVTWTPSNSTTVWASVSRGVRIPSWTEYYSELLIAGTKLKNIIDSNYIDLLPDTLSDIYIKRVLLGSSNVKAEKSVNTELGFRQTYSNWTVDLSLFNTESHNALGISTSVEPNTNTEELLYLCATDYTLCNAYLNELTVITNITTESELTTYGGEFVAKYQFDDSISGYFGYSHASYSYSLPEGIESITSSDSTLKQWMLNVTATIDQYHSLYSTLRYQNGEAYSVDSYYALDISWNWQISPTIKLNVTGKNLLHGKRIEFGNTSEMFLIPTYIEPSFTAKLNFAF